MVAQAVNKNVQSSAAASAACSRGSLFNDFVRLPLLIPWLADGVSECVDESSQDRLGEVADLMMGRWPGEPYLRIAKVIACTRERFVWRDERDWYWAVFCEKVKSRDSRAAGCSLASQTWLLDPRLRSELIKWTDNALASGVAGKSAPTDQLPEEHVELRQFRSLLQYAADADVVTSFVLRNLPKKGACELELPRETLSQLFEVAGVDAGSGVRERVVSCLTWLHVADVAVRSNGYDMSILKAGPIMESAIAGDDGSLRLSLSPLAWDLAKLLRCGEESERDATP